MPASWAILRAALGLIAMFAAYYLSRTMAKASKGQRVTGILIGWALRLVLALSAIWYMGGFDLFGYVLYGLAALSGAAGFYAEWRPKHDDELTKVMFPDGQ